MTASSREYAFARTHRPFTFSRRHAFCFVQVQVCLFFRFFDVLRQGRLPCPLGIGGGFIIAAVGGGGE